MNDDCLTPLIGMVLDLVCFRFQTLVILNSLKSALIWSFWIFSVRPEYKQLLLTSSIANLITYTRSDFTPHDWLPECTALTYRFQGNSPGHEVQGLNVLYFLPPLKWHTYAKTVGKIATLNLINPIMDRVFLFVAHLAISAKTKNNPVNQ